MSSRLIRLLAPVAADLTIGDDKSSLINSLIMRNRHFSRDCITMGNGGRILIVVCGQ